MKLLLLVLLATIVFTLPFVWLKQPWALRLWQRARMIAVIYALIILVSAIVALVFRWDAIYG
jgi:hypothetical protein